MPGKQYSADDILGVMLRRKWLVLLPFALGLAAIPYLSRLVPEQYKSETLIRVIPQRVPDSYVRSNVTSTVEDRLPAITDVITSRSSLERIITQFDLYKERRAKGLMEDAIRQMRDTDTTVKLEGKESFRISYVNHDPHLAQRVTAQLASLYISENTNDRESLADRTNGFLESQLDDAKQRLLEHEKKLEAYRQRYGGELPSQLQTNVQSIQNAQMQLQTTGDANNRLRDRQLMLERQIADAQLASQGGIDLNAAATTAQQLDTMKTQLEQARQRYTANHPDVRALERTIAELQARMDREAKQPAPPPSRNRIRTPAEVADQKHVRDLGDELASVNRQIAAGEDEERQLKKTISDYQGRVAAAPARESELVELTRDYSTLQATYAGLLAKRQDSQVAANLERRQISEQFRILDQASLPVQPSNQRVRLGVMSSGAVAGLLLGLVLVGFVEYRDSSFKREDDVHVALSLPVLAMVPLMASAGERRSRRRRMLMLNLAATAVFLFAVAILLLWTARS